MRGDSPLKLSIVYSEELRNSIINLTWDSWAFGPCIVVIIAYWICRANVMVLFLSVAAVMPVRTSMYIAAVWSFMTAKWGLLLFLYCRMYVRILVGHDPPLISIWWNIQLCLPVCATCQCLWVFFCIMYSYLPHSDVIVLSTWPYFELSKPYWELLHYWGHCYLIIEQ